MSPTSGPPSEPTSPDTDTIIPFHFWDDLPHVKAICLTVGFRLDEQLDPERLRNSLSRLLELGNWRKLGSRLRMDSSGKLTYHLPPKFTSDRPGFIFTTEHQDQNITTHPLASQMPAIKEADTQNPKVHVIDCMSKYNSLFRHETAPSCLQDYLENDIPQLFIHTLLFNDATLLGVTFQHTLTDAMGLSGLIKAWTAVLSGKEEVPPFLGFDEDILEKHTEDRPASQHALAGNVFGWFQLGVAAIWKWWEEFRFPVLQDKGLVIPAEVVRRLREQTMRELDTGGEGPRPFVSESDVLLAWLATMLIPAHNPSPQCPVNIANVFDIRSALALPSPGVYIGNATLGASAAFEAGEFGSAGANPLSDCRLGSVAMKIRRALELQRTKEQVFASSALGKETLRKTGHLPMVGQPGQLSILCTNWGRGGFFDVDFGGARVGGDGSPCRPSYVNAATPGGLDKRAMRNLVAVTGKDGYGNWWVQMVAREEIWEKIGRWTGTNVDE
ncbi:Transferase [Penicillium bovifimosum]|uniref:Transferase n=1 Tax=Penicillium bovifimosum TaxID=126998 RepID=A0A9W9KZT6_9EURO|nr:Transferase [Penicillium bovifimosum]KAJ5129364.1 Transferase [Penicillium bovifimosum]